MIHFKHTEGAGGGESAERGGVEAGAEDDVLANAVRVGRGELVFSEAAAGDHERAEVAGDRGVVAAGIGVKMLDGVAGDGDGDGIVEDLGVVEELVSCTKEGDAESGAAGARFLHRDIVPGEEKARRERAGPRKRGRREPD